MIKMDDNGITDFGPDRFAEPLEDIGRRLFSVSISLERIAEQLARIADAMHDANEMIENTTLD